MLHKMLLLLQYSKLCYRHEFNGNYSFEKNKDTFDIVKRIIYTL